MSIVNISPVKDRIPAEHLAVLHRDNWFRSLSPGLQKEILRRSVIRHYAAGALIYAAGDDPGGAFAVIAGEVRLLHYSPGGKYSFYVIFQPGEWFGALSEMDGQPRFSDATATLDSALLHLGHDAFQTLFHHNDEAREAFTALLCQSLRTTLTMLTEGQASAPRTHIAQILVSVYSRAKLSGPESVPKLTHEALAAMAGVSRQTVSKILRQFQNDGLVQLKYGRVVPVNIRALSEISREA